MISRFIDKEETNEYLSDEVFSTTCHETAHSSHANAMNGLPQFWQVESRIQESWAVGVEWQITHIEYSNRGIGNYGEWDYHPDGDRNIQFPNDQGYQFWNRQRSGNYTSLFINLIDNHNEIGVFYTFFGFGRVNDNVTGYNLAFIEQNLLKHTYGLSSLDALLKANKPTGVTDVQLDNLLSFYY